MSTRYETRDGAAWITLASPENRNAMTDALIGSLRAVETALALRHRRRFKARVAVPRHLQLDLADLGRDRLRIAAVTRVPGSSPLDRVALIA